MLIGTKQQLSKVNLDSLTVGSIDVAPVTCGEKIHYLTMEFRVKLHAKKILITDAIGYQSKPSSR